MIVLVLVLYVVMAAALYCGYMFFQQAASAIHEIEGLMCFLMATVALSGAVVASAIVAQDHARQRQAAAR